MWKKEDDRGILGSKPIERGRTLKGIPKPFCFGFASFPNFDADISAVSNEAFGRGFILVVHAYTRSCH